MTHTVIHHLHCWHIPHRYCNFQYRLTRWCCYDHPLKFPSTGSWYTAANIETNKKCMAKTRTGECTTETWVTWTKVFWSMVSGLHPSDNQRRSNCLAYASMQSVCDSLQSISAIHSQRCGKAAGTLRVANISLFISSHASNSWNGWLHLCYEGWPICFPELMGCCMCQKHFLHHQLQTKTTGELVIMGNQKVSEFQCEGNILHVISINPETRTSRTAMWENFTEHSVDSPIHTATIPLPPRSVRA